MVQLIVVTLQLRVVKGDSTVITLSEQHAGIYRYELCQFDYMGPIRLYVEFMGNFTTGQTAVLACNWKSVEDCLHDGQAVIYLKDQQIVTVAPGQTLLLLSFTDPGDQSTLTLAKISRVAYQANTTTVSILVPVYNKEQYVRRCLDSIMRQQLQNYEVIIVNDGSSDQSADILSEYRDRHPGVIRIIDLKQNAGLLNARAVAVRAARGQYVSIVDSDDELRGDSVLELAYWTAFSNGHPDIVAFQASVNGKGTNAHARPLQMGYSVHGIAKKYRKAKGMPYLWAKIIKTERYLRVVDKIDDILDQHISMFEGILQTCILHEDATSYYGLDHVGYNYYINEDGLTQNRNIVARKVHALAVIYRKFVDLGFTEDKFCIAQNKAWLRRQLARASGSTVEELEEMARDARSYGYEYGARKIQEKIQQTREAASRREGGLARQGEGAAAGQAAG